MLVSTNHLGSCLGGLVLQPLQDRLDCDGLNLPASILASSGPLRQMRVFGFATKKRRIELSPSFKENFPYS
jgi:hypothetical protein